MKHVVNGIELDMTPEDVLALETDQALFVPYVKTILYKSTFIRRLTAQEAGALEEVLNTEEAYLRLLYNSVEWFDTSDGLVSYLSFVLTDAFGEERASALLEPEA